MKYYRLNFTLSTKVRGNSEFIKKYSLKIPNDNMFWEEPKFLGNIRNEKIEFQPYILDIELFSNAKIHDLIMGGGPISTKLTISGKLKSILEDFRKTGMQFFNINVLRKNEVFSDYWILNMYEFNQEVIDFSKCKIIYQEKPADFEVSYLVNEKDVTINNEDEFNEFIKKTRRNDEIVWIEKLVINNINEDFFILKYVNGGIGYFVSENLKHEIEDAGCTGVEFQPIELSYNEWTAHGGEREKVYGKA
jgi:hypothetical protein